MYESEINPQFPQSPKKTHTLNFTNMMFAPPWLKWIILCGAPVVLTERYDTVKFYLGKQTHIQVE